MELGMMNYNDGRVLGKFEGKYWSKTESIEYGLWTDLVATMSVIATRFRYWTTTLFPVGRKRIRIEDS